MKLRSKIGLLGIVGFLIVAYMFMEPYWIETKEVTIESDQIPAQLMVKK